MAEKKKEKPDKKDVEQEMKDKRDENLAEVVDEVVALSSMKADRDKYMKALQDIAANMEKVEKARTDLLTSAQRIQGAIAYINAQLPEEPEDVKTDTPEVGAETETPEGSEPSEAPDSE